MKKFKDHFKESLNYLREKNIINEIWYEIRNNLTKWYIYNFADDSIGIDMLVEYIRKVNKIEEKIFFENMVNLVLLNNLSKDEKEKVYNIAKQSFLDGLFYFEEEYILKFIGKDFLQKCIEEKILIKENEELKFQNILIQTYLAACKINEEKIEINDDLFVNWLENSEGEYIDNQIKILYIFSMVNLEKFNKEYLKPKLARFLEKIDTKDDFSIAQSIIDIYEIAEKFQEEYPTLFIGTDEDYTFVEFLGLAIEGDIIEHNYKKYDSMITMRYMEEDGVKIDYTKAKEDGILMKLLDEDGTVDMLVEDYEVLKDVMVKIEKSLKEDYCRNWEIKGI